MSQLNITLLWGCRTHRLPLYRGVSPPTIAQSAGTVEYNDCFPQRGKNSPPNEYLEYGTKQPDGEAPVILKLWRMWSTPSLISLQYPYWPGVIAPEKFRSIGSIELNCVLVLNWITRNKLFWHLNYVLILNRIVLNKTVLTCKQRIYLWVK